jgi:hypothetical protein
VQGIVAAAAIAAVVFVVLPNAEDDATYRQRAREAKRLSPSTEWNRLYVQPEPPAMALPAEMPFYPPQREHDSLRLPLGSQVRAPGGRKDEVVLWKPLVTIDENGRAAIPLPNLPAHTRLRVSVLAVAGNGTVTSLNESFAPPSIAQLLRMNGEHKFRVEQPTPLSNREACKLSPEAADNSTRPS